MHRSLRTPPWASSSLSSAKKKELERTGIISSDCRFVDPYSDWQSLDIYLFLLSNGCATDQNLVVKYYPKQSVSAGMEHKLRALNCFLQQAGVTLKYVIEETSGETFKAGPELLKLLHEYWGSHAQFRNIKVYKNPNEGSGIMEISQGEIVQTLIDEYENVKAGKDWRDVFLTAPTGAGKSLLFQLPAFHISKRGDVTIVVSPLIALMKDQVNAIITQRNFTKVAYINSEVSLMDRQQIITKCQNGEIDILYMAPELLMSYDMTYVIGTRHIGLLVIDEAHLITTWGRDFRVDYWYIGNHINKIRKYSGQKFPMIAVTATAVYGGEKNDMVFDTVDSLIMHAPHYYIGMVKREDIEFQISNYKATAGSMDTDKIKQTTACVKKLEKLGYKTLVYAPYTSQVKKLAVALNDEGEIAVKYFGGTLDALTKEQSEQSFRMNEKRVMVCTKAFGMGVDIPDIQAVYHHAPSGLLPDYVQEIGRAARQEGLQGYALLDYDPHDLKYSKQLYSISALKLYQLKAVLKKVYDTYVNNGCKRNMLVSVDSFSFAFSDADDVDTKVKTALMMIEKDYLAKYRYNVLLARPQQFYSKVYALVSESDYRQLLSLYPDTLTFVEERPDRSRIILMDLNILWQKYMSNMSFPVLKRNYHYGRLFKDLTVDPKLKITLQVPDIAAMQESMKEVLDYLNAFYTAQSNSWFTKDDLVQYLKEKYDDRTSRQLATFILSSFASEQSTLGRLEEDAFMQERPGTTKQYRSVGTRFEGSLASLQSLILKVFENNENQVYRFLGKDNSSRFVRIGTLMEILNVGSYEMLGGESQMIFIRLNNPELVEADSHASSYHNSLLEKSHERHEISLELMNYFFTHQFTNEERWNFIEDFFLGEDNETLFQKYPGEGEIGNFDIAAVLGERSAHVSEASAAAATAAVAEYPPREGKYMPKDHLTIEVNGEKVTRKISEWVEEDPCSLYPMIQKKIIQVDVGHVYNALINRIRERFPEYYTRIQGLRKMIDFTGYSQPVMASVIYDTDPVKFYRWWVNHRDEVYLSLPNKIRLIDTVARINPKVIKKEDMLSPIRKKQ